MASPAKFIREVRQEVGKVTWPTRKETMVSTIMIIILVIIAALFFLLIDSLAAKLVGFVLGFGG